jgi:hypothetical protein
LPDNAVLLADARLVLKPDFHRNAGGDIGQMRLQRLRKVFLYASTISAFWPGWRGRALM